MKIHKNLRKPRQHALSKRRKITIALVVIALLAIIISISVALAIANQENSENQDTTSSESADSSKEAPLDAKENSCEEDSDSCEENSTDSEETSEKSTEETTKETSAETSTQPTTNTQTTGNCTINWGPLMLINYNFTVDPSFIATRRSQLVNLTAAYGITELNSYNGTPLLDAEAAVHLNDMINDYKSTHQGHEIKTVSCFRSYGTSCGRLCAATGTSDHHTGYTCDLIDPAYGTELNTDTLPNHIEWQWLKENSYKYGFIDRYPEHWAGSSMAQPLVVNENGTTGYYETWHYRYVGIPAATDIATGKYNGGVYDSLEHYLKATGHLKSLTSGSC